MMKLLGECHFQNNMGCLVTVTTLRTGSCAGCSARVKVDHRVWMCYDLLKGKKNALLMRTWKWWMK